MREGVKTVPRQVWAHISGVSVWVKTLGIALSVVALLVATVLLQVRTVMRLTLAKQLEERGISIVQDLAARSINPILTNDTFRLYELLRGTVDNNIDVRYAFVLDHQGQLIVHSFGGSFPPDLTAANPVPSDLPLHLEILDTEEGLIWDLAVPLLKGEAGTVRLGMSQARLNDSLNQVTFQVLLIAAVASMVGTVFSYVLSRQLNKPITDLLEATRAVAAGDFSRKISPRAADEIGQLVVSFNAMVDDLATARQRSDDWQSQLLHQNQVLSALIDVARLGSQRLSPEQTVREALKSALDVAGQEEGWACLLTEDRSSATVIVSSKLPEYQSLEGRHDCDPEPKCQQAMYAGYPLAFDRKSFTCSASHCCQVTDHSQGGVILVPLVSQSHPLGMIGLVSLHRGAGQSNNLTALAAMGRQTGLALENARLWEALKRKEELRGKLLDKVIAVQEEERRRVARELHDELGQVLTSIIVGLRVAEGASEPNQVRALYGQLRETAASTLERARNLALELRPSVLDDLGLVAALERYFATYTRTYGPTVDFQAIGLKSTRLAPEMEITLYRIVQEALTNIAKHAKANHVSILLEKKKDSVVAIVEDDGQGFDVEQVLRSGADNRLGLYGMQERATLVGGTLTLESSPGSGTSVFLEIPLANEERWEGG